MGCRMSAARHRPSHWVAHLHGKSESVSSTDTRKKRDVDSVTQDQLSAFEDAFKAFDLNNSGDIDKDELRKVRAHGSGACDDVVACLAQLRSRPLRLCRRCSPSLDVAAIPDV